MPYPLLNSLDLQVIIILTSLTLPQSKERTVIILIVISMYILVAHILSGLSRMYTHLLSTNTQILNIPIILLLLPAHLIVNHIYTPPILHHTTVPIHPPYSSSPNLPLFNSTRVDYTHHPLHLLYLRFLCLHSIHTPTLHHHRLLDINTLNFHSSRSRSIIVIMGYVLVFACLPQSTWIMFVYLVMLVGLLMVKTSNVLYACLSDACILLSI